MLNTDQFAAARQASLDTFISLAGKTFEGFEQLTALNLQTAKSALDEAAGATLAALSVKDAPSLLAVQASLLQPSAEKAAAYGRQVVDIVAGTKAEFEKMAAEQFADVQTQIIAAVDAATKNAPEGATQGIAFFKSAMASANDAFDSIQKATRQAADVAEANYTAMSGAVAPVTKAPKAKRA